MQFAQLKAAFKLALFLLVFSLSGISYAQKAHNDHSQHYRKPGQLQLIEYQLINPIEPFELIDLNLSILPYLPYTTDQLDVTITAEKGVELTKDATEKDAKTWQLQFKANQLGRLYLNIYVREKNARQVEQFIPKVQQIFSIPIQVGDEL